ncbi:uncharacterized protein K441DRAFT_278185 [Cenococcum geophilum 1.58]|uniref:uncharacterized protein n=1 Tax=Cenococcum geophilum 1.58 TaxID=794803 RepID=UPI00358E1333|nr:hypothetical protein K441DRAFT_278185 [Cenococcum geophilum 1.58]
MSLKLVDKAAAKTEMDKHKITIQDLYLKEDRTLKEIMDIMAGSYDFVATKTQYERHFRKWGFRKNVNPSVWKFINHRQSKRKRAGKESDVYIDGVLVPKDKIRKEIGRNSVSTIEKYRRGNPPYNRSIPMTKPG